MDIKCPAKINLGLSVGEKREDGYHGISSIFATASLFDTLSIQKSGAFLFEATGEAIPQGEANIVEKAAKALESYTGTKILASIRLHKAIPIGAGLGGGSSDAACAVVGLNKELALGLSCESMLKIAESLGSDVPFLIKGGVAFCEGRGEVITPLDESILAGYSALLVMPGIHISTKLAYERIDALRAAGEAAEPCDFERAAACLAQGDTERLPFYLKNHFEEFAFREFASLKAIKSELYSCGAFFASMSGSGSTVYGLFKGTEIEQASAHFSGSGYRTHICSLLGGLNDI
ncbi:MAG: 4-(cytidine 5'-diphospho)-2-C-methyl-D-erythritol kinase [Eubacteriaceae bacterium]|nr:4-(cytidine 5'-diphospho)-2-C-methyl-D-erythritol kinase [Eubacteriaceae bacterium]